MNERNNIKSGSNVVSRPASPVREVASKGLKVQTHLKAGKCRNTVIKAAGFGVRINGFCVP